MWNLGIMVGNNPKQEAETTVEIHRTYLVEFYTTDYFRHQDMVGSYQTGAYSMAFAIEHALTRIPRGRFLFAKVQEIDSTYFELFGITHGIRETVITGLRDDQDDNGNHPTVGPLLCANETGRRFGNCGGHVA